jgi:hypothetical protein
LLVAVTSFARLLSCGLGAAALLPQGGFTALAFAGSIQQNMQRVRDALIAALRREFRKQNRCPAWWTHREAFIRALFRQRLVLPIRTRR